MNAPRTRHGLLSCQTVNPRGSDTAAALIKMARQKAKEGKDAEAIQWAALCNFFDATEQAAIKKDSVQVLQYLKQ